MIIFWSEQVLALPVTQLLYALSLVMRIIFSTKARNVTYNSTLALLTNTSAELFALHIIELGNKAHEISASWNYTLLATRPKCFGELTLVKITQKKQELHKFFRNLNSNHLVTKSKQ